MPNCYRISAALALRQKNNFGQLTFSQLLIGNCSCGHSDHCYVQNLSIPGNLDIQKDTVPKRFKSICNSSVISQKRESQNRCYKKMKHAKFSPKKEHFLPPDTHTHGVRNVRFSENLVCFIF